MNEYKVIQPNELVGKVIKKSINDNDMLYLLTETNEICVIYVDSYSLGCSDYEDEVAFYDNMNDLGDEDKVLLGIISAEDFAKKQEVERLRKLAATELVKNNQRKWKEERELKQLKDLASKYGKKLE